MFKLNRLIRIVLLYIHTIRFLKFKQIYYQLHYRIKHTLFYRIANYKKWDLLQCDIRGIDYPYLYCGNQSIRHLSFDLINQTKEFESTVDWNFIGYGKLWNYHLQYMVYLLDESIPLSQRNDLIKDISNQILKGELKLEPYPVSRRIFSILLFFNNSNKVLDETSCLALTRQIHFLESNLEFHLDANHLLENYMALCFAFCYLNKREKFENYYTKLLEQLNKQLLNDGAHFEKSPTYHLHILYHLILIRQTAEIYFKPLIDLTKLNYYVSIMISWADQMMLSHSNFPLFNDSVYGQNPDYLQLQSVVKHLGIPNKEIELAESGYRKLKQMDFNLIINCGNVVPEFQPGHIHSDILHMVLFIKNQAVLVDFGISTYENNSIRLLEKSTASHNTVCFDNENQSQIWGAFRMAKRAKIQLISSLKNSLEAKLTWHNGFQHTRKILLTENYLRIEDHVVPLNRKFKTTIANFHFDSRIQIVPIETGWYIQQLGVTIFFEGSNQSELVPFEQAVDFNSKLDSTKLVIQFEETLVTYFNLIS